MKSLTIIGSTGSIGTQALNIVKARPKDFKIKALSAGSNIELLIDQIKEFNPEYATVLKDEDKKALQELFPKLQVLKDIKEIASIENVDIVLSAIVGIAGLEANLLALQKAKRVAVANKETLVAAGHLVKKVQKEYGSELIPVDSEHVAIHQCLADNKNSSVKEILLTSSGGPFRTWAKEDFQQITKADALKHPNWSMGAKITIDSSTLVNKGLEVIEAKVLFDIDYDQIKVVVHPQSVIHSGISFIDGNTVAQLSLPDMMVPIQYALDYPEKKDILLGKDFDIFEVSRLDFEKPDLERFPALGYAYEAGRAGGSMPAVYNSANEAAVNLFLNDKLHWTEIPKIIKKELEQHKYIQEPTLEELLALHHEIMQKNAALV